MGPFLPHERAVTHRGVLERGGAGGGEAAEGGGGAAVAAAPAGGAGEVHELVLLSTLPEFQGPTEARKGKKGGGPKSASRTCSVCHTQAYFYCKTCSGTGRPVPICGTNTNRGGACYCSHILEAFKAANGM